MFQQVIKIKANSYLYAIICYETISVESTIITSYGEEALIIFKESSFISPNIYKLWVFSCTSKIILTEHLF